MTGFVNSIQSLGAVDGPGVRYVVFMQGCPLRCVYCHNPDTWLTEGGTPTDADELVRRALRFRPYWKNGGGVTVTGGEPLLQADFVAEFFEKLHEHGVHTALDTSGVGNLAQAEKVLEHTDLVLCDLKFLSKADYLKNCRADYGQIERFLQLTAMKGVPLWIRHVVVPGLTDFIIFKIYNREVDVGIYGGKWIKKKACQLLKGYVEKCQRAMIAAMERSGFRAPGTFEDLRRLIKGYLGEGNKMGEGWLLTAEMLELIHSGTPNIVCTQPFGCLPNHIVGKGMVNKIRALYPSANITPIDYDPSATKVNQENRIKLMLAVAKERLNAPAEAKPLTAEEIAGGAPKVGATV